jgi:hypothetical protein
VARRVKWRAFINKIREFDARIVIPGHCDADKIRIMEDVQADGARSYTECIDWSLKYLDNYEEAYNTARTGMEMVAAMTTLYPDVTAEDFAIHWQARLLFLHSSPSFLCFVEHAVCDGTHRSASENIASLMKSTRHPLA